MDWRNLNEDDYFLLGQAFHSATRKLARTLALEPGPSPELDVCPVLSMYRHCIELHLKIIILGAGGKFLTARPDVLSVHKSRSLPWLAQFVIQIVRTLNWGEEFKGREIESIAQFKTLIDEANAIDPTFDAFRCPVEVKRTVSPMSPGASTTLDFVSRLDALVDLLASTADSLAAEWDLRSDNSGADFDWISGDPKLPIQ